MAAGPGRTCHLDETVVAGGEGMIEGEGGAAGAGMIPGQMSYRRSTPFTGQPCSPCDRLACSSSWRATIRMGWCE
jgi:hypothetical protein